MSEAMPIDPDWCAECGCPIGVGSCDGCCAVSAIDQFDDSGQPECCPHCGKEYEDFSDLGCERCDQRHPRFGVLP